MTYKLLSLISFLGFFGAFQEPWLALPPPEDIPEEILRNEIITEGRSPIDNEPLSTAEYTELQEELAASKFPPELNSDVRNIIFWLQLLQFIRTLTP